MSIFQYQHLTISLVTMIVVTYF